MVTSVKGEYIVAELYMHGEIVRFSKKFETPICMLVISHKSDVKILLKWIINKYPKGTR